MLRMRRMGSCPCKQPEPPIARFRSNPKGSGVGGGVVAILPDELTLCVWSPALDESGNSELGMRALELFVAKTGLSVF